MARWPKERLNQRLDDLRARLSQGETLEQIARAWGTTKQNVSQFRKRHLSRDGETPVSPPKERPAAPHVMLPPPGEDYSLYARAYRTLMAQDRLIQELEAELRELKYRLYMLQQGPVAEDGAKESLKHYLDGRRS